MSISYYGVSGRDVRIPWATTRDCPYDGFPNNYELRILKKEGVSRDENLF